MLIILCFARLNPVYCQPMCHWKVWDQAAVSTGGKAQIVFAFVTMEHLDISPFMSLPEAQQCFKYCTSPNCAHVVFSCFEAGCFLCLARQSAGM